ncbi:hypothetical protein W97_01736 [Coniosporium apollinis CBS 100218]|uniref:Major facilitator superfamily (MFS) profile domain-containing protein n=1 Tax=Coniosporium apollinis (strain CBS 100218) TaxID=1168221 RepID=R7YKV5_CONA1|nr:uncharacterized protein W97_01736 [Coniosporium apollinis CBS 100218]EON62513.1 hypothetical protein W97_01736 [Coniosporium apollinis CBS 100218]
MTKDISDQYVEEVSNASKESIVSADELAKLTDGRGADYITGLPACLRHYSVDQLNALETGFRRKVDRRLLPTLIGMFLLNILDRNNIAAARLQGLEEDLDLHGNQYYTALMILYVGYILMQVPSNMLLPHVKPSLMIPGCMIAWGLVSTLTAATQNFAGLLVCRFFVGFTEAPFFCGAVFLLSGWYKKSELATRITTLYCGNTLANCFGGLIAAGVLHGLDGVKGMLAWRWLFIVEGTATILMAIAAMFILPNWPHNTSWLSAEEKEMARYRLAYETAGRADDEDDSPLEGLKQAVSDPKVWLLVLMQHALLVGMSYVYFFPSIVKTLGYGNIHTLLLTAPPYVFAFITAIIVSWHSGKTNERCYHIVVPILISGLGQVIFVSTLQTGARYFAMFLMTGGAYCAFNVVMSWVSSAIPRPRTKRAVALAMVAALSNASHTYTSYIFPKEDAPRYMNSAIILAVFCVVCACCALGLRFWLASLNKKAAIEEAGDAESGVIYDGHVSKATGMRRGFRYQL